MINNKQLLSMVGAAIAFCFLAPGAAHAKPPVCKLQGQYAFMFSANSGPAGSRVGEFTVSSSGRATGGTEDTLQGIPGGSFVGVNSTITSGSCTTDANGLGTLTLVSGGVTTTYKTVMLASGNARMIEFDDTTGNGIRGSGIIKKQDRTAFSLAKLAGDFVFSFSCGFPNAGGEMGRLTISSSGSISNGVLYENFAASVASGTLQPFLKTSLVNPSAIATVNARSGRGTATETSAAELIAYTPPLSNTSAFAFYVVSADEQFFMQTNSAATGFFVMGEQLRQVGAGSFGLASLNSQMVISLNGTSMEINPETAQSGTNILVGDLLPDGRGNLSGVTDEQDQNNSSAMQPISGSYSVNPDGTGVITFCCAYEGTKVLALAMISPNTAEVLSLSTNNSVGQLEAQSGGFPAGGATYSRGTLPTPVWPSGVVYNSLGVLTFSLFTYTETLDLSFGASPFLESNVAGNGDDGGSSATRIALNARDGSPSLVGYVISPHKFVAISAVNSSFPNATLVRFEQ